MVKHCIVKNCSNEWQPNKKISFHRFPLKRPDILEKWIKNLQLTNFKPSKHSVICGEHFSDCSFNETIMNEKKSLKKDAVPNTICGLQSETIIIISDELLPINADSMECNDDETNASISEANYAPNTFRGRAIQTSPTLINSCPETVLLKRNIENLKKQIKRRDRKIKNYVDLIATLKKKSSTDNNLEEILNNNFSGILSHLMRNQLYNSNREKSLHRYSEEIKKFAITLHFHSSKAYTFLRKDLCLPHPAVIRKWLSSKKGEEN